MKKRLDLILVERELFETREKAKREIMAGNVIVNEQVVTKAGTMLKDNDELNIRIKDKLKYVSRGGLILEHLLEGLQIVPCKMAQNVCIVLMLEKISLTGN